MTSRLYVATRKGLFVLESGSDGYEIRKTAFLGDPVTMILPDDRDGALYAGLNLGHFGVKLHRSEDGGEKWTELAAPAYEKEESKDAPSVSLLWILESSGSDQEGSLWAGTIPGGLFRSDDRGESWTLNQALWDVPERERWFGGGYDHPGIHSVAVHPKDSQHVTVGVSCGGVWITRDGGESWAVRTKGMWAAYMPPEAKEDPAIQDPHRLVQSPSDPDTLFVQHHNGVFRSADGGESWRDIRNVPPSTFGFAAAIHPEDPKTSWTVPLLKDESRMPVDGKVVVARTNDGGDSFELLSKGLPQDNAYDVVYRHGLAVHEDGQRLAMGSTTGSLWVSDDGGDSWTTVSTHLPPVYCVRFG